MSSRSFLAAVLAKPVSLLSPLSSASSSRWTRVTWACCATSKLALRSAAMRRRTDDGSSARSRVAPTRNSLVPRAHSPSFRVRPERPLSTTPPSSSREASFFEVSMSPPPVQSRKSTNLGLPSLVVSRPAAAMCMRGVYGVYGVYGVCALCVCHLPSHTPCRRPLPGFRGRPPRRQFAASACRLRSPWSAVPRVRESTEGERAPTEMCGERQKHRIVGQNAQARPQGPRSADSPGYPSPCSASAATRGAQS